MIRIRPKNYINEMYIKDFYFYTKKEAIKIYLSQFKHLKAKDLTIE